MSGHNKWSTIKHKKGKADAQRGKLFTKLIKEITVAARMGGGDVEGNPRLRRAVDTAKGANMPRDNIARAIKKGTGDLDGVDYVEFSYEGYGPGGVAVLVDVLTDNKNRTVADVRHAFSKHNGSMGEAGCVAWMFDARGVIVTAPEVTDEDAVFMAAAEAGADDIEAADEGGFVVTTDPSELEDVRSALEAAGIPVATAEMTKIPQNTVPIQGKSAEVLMRLIDALEDNEDVQQVYANYDISDEEMERLA